MLETWFGTWERVSRGGANYAARRGDDGRFTHFVPWGDFIRIKQNHAKIKRDVGTWAKRKGLTYAISAALCAIGVPATPDVVEFVSLTL